MNPHSKSLSRILPYVSVRLLEIFAFLKMYIFAHVPVTFGKVHLEIQICSGKLCLNAEV